MIQREELTNQIPANATALKTAKILLPEGASKNFSFAWVCDAKGGLYLSVNKGHMISCGPGSIDLAKTLMIKGAKPVRHYSWLSGCVSLVSCVVVVTTVAQAAKPISCLVAYGLHTVACQLAGAI
jgi:hypothetical protein